MMQYFPKEYGAVLDLMESKKCSFLHAEKKLFPTNHCLIGAAVADKWGFPVNLKSAIEHHHNPGAACDLQDFVAITASANVLTQPDGDKFFAMKGLDECVEACESFHPIKIGAYRMVLGDLEKQMQFFESFLDRMEVFRRPSELVTQEAQRKKGDSGIWTLPGK